MLKSILIIAMCSMLFLVADKSNGPIHKLGRGGINIATGWIEIPKSIYQITVEDGIVVGLSIGTADGIAKAIVRTGGGVYDIVTFPVPIPEFYEPVYSPEFVWQMK